MPLLFVVYLTCRRVLGVVLLVVVERMEMARDHSNKTIRGDATTHFVTTLAILLLLRRFRRDPSLFNKYEEVSKEVLLLVLFMVERSGVEEEYIIMVESRAVLCCLVIVREPRRSGRVTSPMRACVVGVMQIEYTYIYLH